MSSRQFLIGLFFFIQLFSTGVLSQVESNERHTEVVLRMMGHRILLSLGDSVSRVLPIEKEGNEYKISFNSSFSFDSGSLVAVVDSVVKETKIAKSYIVDLVSCESKKTLYSFEFGKEDSLDLIPCRTRIQEEACYDVLFTILDPILPNKEEVESGLSLSLVILFGFIILMFIILLVYFLRKKSKINPNVVLIGKYQFDTRNMELLFEDKKIELTSKEADLLFLLHDSINVTVERDDILKSVWGDEGDYIGRTLDVYISKLRKKLEEDLEVKIVNIRGVGYKLVG